MAANTHDSIKFQGVRKRLDLLTKVNQPVQVTIPTLAAIDDGASGANWFRTAGTRVPLAATLSSSDPDQNWVVAVPAATGAAVDVATVALLPGRYHVDLDLLVANGTGAADIQIALSDDGPLHDGDGNETALFDTGLTIPWDVPANTGGALHLSFLIDLTSQDTGVDSDSDDVVDTLQGRHLVYLCVANNGAAAATALVGGEWCRLTFTPLG